MLASLDYNFEGVDTLPSAREGVGEESEQEESEEESEDEVDDVYEVPIGFQSLEKPDELLTRNTDLMGLYIFMLWENCGWEVGKRQV